MNTVKRAVVNVFWFIGLTLVATTPVFAGDICAGSALCFISFCVIGYGPYFAILTGIFFLIFKFLRPKLDLTKKLKFSMLISFGLILLHYLILAPAIEKFQIVSNDKKQISNVSFSLYVPKYLPKDYSLEEVQVVNIGHGNYLDYLYYRTGNYFRLSEFEKPNKITLSNKFCQVYGGSKSAFEIRDESYSLTMSGYSGECQEMTTPKGNIVYKMNYEATLSSPKRNLAMTIKENTLLAIVGYDFSDEELGMFVDSLEIKTPQEIEFKVRDRTIGR